MPGMQILLDEYFGRYIDSCVISQSGFKYFWKAADVFSSNPIG